MAVDSEFINNLIEDGTLKAQRLQATKRGIESYKTLQRLAEKCWRSSLPPVPNEARDSSKAKLRPLKLRNVPCSRNVQLGKITGSSPKEIGSPSSTLELDRATGKSKTFDIKEIPNKPSSQKETEYTIGRFVQNEHLIQYNPTDVTQFSHNQIGTSKTYEGTRINRKLQPLKPIYRSPRFPDKNKNGSFSKMEHRSSIPSCKRPRLLVTSNFINNNGTIEYSQKWELERLQKMQNEYKDVSQFQSLQDHHRTACSLPYLHRQKTTLLLQKIDELLDGPKFEEQPIIIEYQTTSVIEERLSSMNPDDPSSDTSEAVDDTVIELEPFTQCSSNNIGLHASNHDGREKQSGQDSLMLVLKDLSFEPIDVYDKCNHWLQANPVA